MEDRTDYIPIKCHECGKVLRAGTIYTLECECGSCSIHYNRHGEIAEYVFWFFKDKKEYCIALHPYEKPYLSHMARKLIELDATMQFENGVPQVQKMFEKMRIMIVFS